MRRTIILSVLAVLSLAASVFTQPAISDMRVREVAFDTDRDGTYVLMVGTHTVPEDAVVPRQVGDIYNQVPPSVFFDRRGLTVWVAVEDGALGSEDWTPFWSTMMYRDQFVIADSGDGNPATGNVTPQYIRNLDVQCGDVDECNATVVETTSEEGAQFQAYNNSANVFNWADTNGVSNLAGAFAAGQNDSISMIYAGFEWLEVGRSDN